jgi:hypothetical protein
MSADERQLPAPPVPPLLVVPLLLVPEGPGPVDVCAPVPVVSVPPPIPALAVEVVPLEPAVLPVAPAPPVPA